jgi:hypothetical protein
MYNDIQLELPVRERDCYMETLTADAKNFNVKLPQESLC